MRKIEVIYIIWKKTKITFRDQMNILYVEQKPWHIGRWHALFTKKRKKKYFKVLELLDYFKPANLKHEAISTVELVCFLRILLSFVEAHQYRLNFSCWEPSWKTGFCKYGEWMIVKQVKNFLSKSNKVGSLSLPSILGYRSN